MLAHTHRHLYPANAQAEAAFSPSPQENPACLPPEKGRDGVGGQYMRARREAVRRLEPPRLSQGR